jgi:hypothetical protein
VQKETWTAPNSAGPVEHLNSEHPSRECLRRFFAGLATLGETQAIVRHLLHGCRECSRDTLELWRPEA